MSREEYPITPAVRLFREKKIDFIPHLYPYEEKGGTHHSAVCLGIPEHAVIKTLVMESDPKHPFIILMHGDREVSTKQLARVLGVKAVNPCAVEVAQRHTGYQVGGTSPFGTRTPLRVYAETTIFSLPRIWINGGKRGFLFELDPAVLKRLLDVTEVEVSLEK